MVRVVDLQVHRVQTKIESTWEVNFVKVIDVGDHYIIMRSVLMGIDASKTNTSYNNDVSFAILRV